MFKLWFPAVIGFYLQELEAFLLPTLPSVSVPEASGCIVGRPVHLQRAFVVN